MTGLINKFRGLEFQLDSSCILSKCVRESERDVRIFLRAIRSLSSDSTAESECMASMYLKNQVPIVLKTKRCGEKKLAREGWAPGGAYQATLIVWLYLYYKSYRRTIITVIRSFISVLESC